MFSSWARDQNLWTFHPDEAGNGPTFDLYLGSQVIVFSCYGLSGDQMNKITDVMQALGAPLHDPLIDERFALR